jgi:hypothetical protein
MKNLNQMKSVKFNMFLTALLITFYSIPGLCQTNPIQLNSSAINPTKIELSKNCVNSEKINSSNLPVQGVDENSCQTEQNSMNDVTMENGMNDVNTFQTSIAKINDINKSNPNYQYLKVRKLYC